jgi:hypothetical protein
MNEPWLFVTGWLEFSFCQGCEVGISSHHDRTLLQTNPRPPASPLVAPKEENNRFVDRTLIGIGLIFHHTTSQFTVAFSSYTIVRPSISRTDHCLLHHQQRKMLASPFSAPSLQCRHALCRPTRRQRIPPATTYRPLTLHLGTLPCARARTSGHRSGCSISPVPVDRPPWI